MRKLLAGLFLTFRWLLVAVLPVVGLLLGMWLKPEMKPRWEYQLEKGMTWAGIVSDQEQNVVLIRSNKTESSIQRTWPFIGLETSTGKELWSRNVYQPYCGTDVSINPTYRLQTHTLCWNNTDNNPTLRVYDWNNNEVARYDCPEQMTLVISLQYQGKNLAVDQFSSSKRQLVYYRPGHLNPMVLFEDTAAGVFPEIKFCPVCAQSQWTMGSHRGSRVCWQSIF